MPKVRSDDAAVSISIFICWILPAFLIVVSTRIAVDLKQTPSGNQYGINNSRRPSQEVIASSMDEQLHSQIKTSRNTNMDSTERTEMTLLDDKPLSYQEVVLSIGRRRLDRRVDSPWGGVPRPSENGKLDFPSTNGNVSPAPGFGSKSASGHAIVHDQSSKVRGQSQDPVRKQLIHQIEKLREAYSKRPGDVFGVAALADALRMYDVQYHDGGTTQEEAIATYQHAIKIGLELHRDRLAKGESPSERASNAGDINDEIMLDYKERSANALLCALYTGLGKVFFMSNMFEQAVDAYNEALEIDPLYLDAISSRGSSRIILGQFEEAALDFLTVIENDTKRRFQDVFTGLARILQAKENVVPGGWDPMMQILNEMIPLLERQVDNAADPATEPMLWNTLNRFYHVLYLYHDVKTKDVDSAWNALTKSYDYKMRSLPAWINGSETQKISATKQIFQKGFWAPGMGSQLRAPIFIVGFVRSGSTLLERVLDSHSQVVGTGENSVFNGQLDRIRNKIVEASMSGDAELLSTTIESLANDVVNEMRRRWRMVASADNRSGGEEPLRFVDKMLTNYYNIGFIHMLFPEALILHVAREPMDTLFSAFKHEFPSGLLDYTSDFNGLAELYHGYRDLMEHWDKQLPGRVIHIRYEDMVHDMEGVARKIIESAGLRWEDDILNFHMKKQAVNTLSTTQVRRGVYSDSLHAWRRYEAHLQGLLGLIGDRKTYDLRTTLPGYIPKSSGQEDNTDYKL